MRTTSTTSHIEQTQEHLEEEEEDPFYYYDLTSSSENESEYHTYNSQRVGIGRRITFDKEGMPNIKEWQWVCCCVSLYPHYNPALSISHPIKMIKANIQHLLVR